MLEGKEYHIHFGDCIPHMAELPSHCFDFSVFSPPFPSLYSYTGQDCDIGNSEDLEGNGKVHLSFFYRQLARLVKPGRAVVVHVMQIPRMKRTGGVGLFDFRGLNIRLGERAGLIYEYDWVVRKNPQAQAIKTRTRELQFVGLESDRAKSRGALPDYLIKFVVPGENKTPVDSQDQVSRNDWIEYAECAWMNIKETNTLNLKGTKGEDDTRHVCPLQLEVIDRLVKLYSNPGEIVFSPFTGIGSEGYISLKRHRKFYGCEIKPEYHKTAISNLELAIRIRDNGNQGLFDQVENQFEELSDVDAETEIG